jgi:hypothetical protein
MTQKEKEARARLEEIEQELEDLQTKRKAAQEAQDWDERSRLLEEECKRQHEQYYLTLVLKKYADNSLKKLRKGIVSIRPEAVREGDRLVYLNKKTNRWEATEIKTILIDKNLVQDTYRFITKNHMEVAYVYKGNSMPTTVNIFEG